MKLLLWSSKVIVLPGHVCLFWVTYHSVIGISHYDWGLLKLILQLRAFIFVASALELVSANYA